MGRITNGSFAGPAGNLEYVLNLPDDLTSATRAAVICHPHPLHGGTLHTRIVFHTARTLQEMGIPVLRFNFRGVGRSAGEHAQGHGEVDDVRAALDYMEENFRLPLVLGGFSFGSVVALRLLASSDEHRVERCLVLGLPASQRELPMPLQWQGPKLFISGDQDEFGHKDDVEAYFAHLDEPKRLIFVAGADHFLTGRMQDFQQLLRANLDFETE